jgi:FMN phosphatase YigB (HAD superfamily)
LGIVLCVTVAKPDPSIFRAALDRLWVPAEHVLMVGDRGGYDGAATAVGSTSLLVVERLDSPGWLPIRLVYYAGRKLDLTVDPIAELSQSNGQDRAAITNHDQLGRQVTSRSAR